MTRARPLRFLVLVLGLWVGARAAMLALRGAPTTDASAILADATPIRPAPTLPHPSTAPQIAAQVAARAAAQVTALARAGFAPPASCCLISELSYKTVFPHSAARVAPVSLPQGSAPGAQQQVAVPQPAAGASALRPVPAPVREAASAPASTSRWSGSAWLLIRDGLGQAALAPGGTLGGSQAGARLLYRLGGGFSLNGRAYAPLRQTEGAEVAAGIDWQPSARLPVHLLAERRQDVGGAGRSAFALTVYGGVGRRLLGGLRVEAYAQAGMVGIRSRDLFVDASARVSMPIGPVVVGGSAWAAAQPGAARLDAGPSASYRLPVRGVNLRLQGDWRFRITGDAAPRSGRR